MLAQKLYPYTVQYSNMTSIVFEATRLPHPLKNHSLSCLKVVKLAVPAETNHYTYKQLVFLLVACNECDLRRNEGRLATHGKVGLGGTKPSWLEVVLLVASS